MGVFIKELSAEGMTYKEYLAYVDSVKGKLPPAAYEYAAATWHYDLSNPRSIHDAWLQKATIVDTIADRPESTNIEIAFLGAFHDRVFRFNYTGVVAYSFTAAILREAHSDVYFDEIRLSERINCIHEILFMSNVRWIIESKGFQFSEEPISK